jgi:adenylate cyclase
VLRTELDAIGTLLHTFESLAFDVIAETPGRVVKLIGDEVMFVCPESGEATRAALQILDGGAKLGLPPARGGLAEGRVLRQGGDYFGTPVNRASRIAQIASPGTVLVDDAVRTVGEGKQEGTKPSRPAKDPLLCAASAHTRCASTRLGKR